MNESPAPLDGPIWLRRELLAGGQSDRSLAHLVRVGQLRRVRRGAYTDGGTHVAADDAARHALLARAVVEQAQTAVVLSHLSALPFHEAPLWGMPLDVVHVTRPDGRAGRSEAGVRQHRGRILEGDVVMRHGLEVTSPTRTALDITKCLGAEASLVVVNDLLHRRLTTIENLRRRYEPMTQDPHTLKTELVLRLADPRPESIGESRTFWMLFKHGVPAPVPQYEVLDGAGHVFARLDFAWPDLRAWLEFDGRIKYVEHRRAGESVVDAVLREKERESRISELTGWRCVRITWADLQRPSATVARIVAALGISTRVPSFTS